MRTLVLTVGLMAFALLVLGTPVAWGGEQVKAKASIWSEDLDGALAAARTAKQNVLLYAFDSY